MIDFDSFVEWCESRFNRVEVKGNEVKVPSIFTEDTKTHLWMNPKGGVHHRDDGCYRCFYTENKGTLVGLVMLVDSCTYEEAKEILSGHTPIGVLEDKLEEFFKEKELQEEFKKEIKLKLPEHSVLITDLPSCRLKTDAETYLIKRKLPVESFYVCSKGNYVNRIVIPYFDVKGSLIYFNTRNMRDNGLRYCGPDKELGVGKSDVLYAPKWPNKKSKIYLTEGEFDALTLCVCGFNGIACGGKVLSDKQILLIKDYKICLALDEDASGLFGLKIMAAKLVNYQVSDITYCRPPKGIKDWNKMLVMFKPEIVQGYINSHEKNFDDFTNVLL